MEQDGVVQLFLYLFSIQQHLFIKHFVISHSQDVSVVTVYVFFDLLLTWLLHSDYCMLKNIFWLWKYISLLNCI